jgi:nitrate/nitrite transporter NarK
VQAQKANPYRWTVFAVLLPIQFVLGLNFFGPASLFPLMMEEFGISRGTVSLLVVAVTLTQTFLLIPGGILAARLGPRRSLTIGGLLVGVGIIGGLGPSFPVLVALRAAFGVGASILLPATSSVVVRWFNAREVPFVNGANMGVPGIGVGAAMFGGVPLAGAVGWEGVFFVYGLLTLAATAAWAAFGRDGEGSATSTTSLKQVLATLKERNTLLLALSTIGPLGLFVAYSSWLPTYYNEVFGMPLAQASAIITIVPLLGAAVQVFSGVFLARAGVRRPFLVFPCLVLPAVAAGTFLFDNLAVVVVSIMTFGALSSIFMPTLFTVIMELPGMSSQRVALVIGAVLTLGNLATAVSPLAVGASTDILGTYIPSLAVLALSPLLTAMVCLRLPETGPKAVRRPIPAPPVAIS